MAKLQKLSVSQNELTGPLPEAWTQLLAIAVLDASFNDLDGTIPEGR